MTEPVKVCKNPGCGKPIVRKFEEPWPVFRRRKLCNPQCRHEFLTVPVLEARNCANPQCGKPLERRVGESRSNFKRRRTCNHSCSSAAQRQQVPARTCQNVECGREFERRRNEAPGQFAVRQFCSPACVLAAKRKPTLRPAPQPEPAPVAQPGRRRKPEIDVEKFVDEWRFMSGFGWNVSRFAREMRVDVNSLIKAARANPQVGGPILAAWQREIEMRRVA